MTAPEGRRYPPPLMLSVMRLNFKESIMLSRLFSLVVVWTCTCVTASADQAFLLKTDRTSATDGYWNTDRGYFVGCYHHSPNQRREVDEADPGLVSFRLGLVHGGRLHPGPFGVGVKELQIIGNMWLVIREGDTVILRVPTKAEVDPGNHVHLHAQFNATAELLPKMEIEFEERLESGTRRIRVPLRSFMNDR